jgi:serine O-acetyltransferase
MARDISTTLAYISKIPFIGRLAYFGLKVLGVEIPRSVVLGKNLEIAHGGFGLVIHSRTIVGNRVKIYPGVTIGRADIYIPADQSNFDYVVIEDDVILSPGCKVLGKDGILKVGEGTVVGANSVLLESTGKWEIWAGSPAKKISERNLCE